MRSSLALIATVGVLAVALTGCAGASEPEAATGASSDAVEVQGDFGAKPRVDFPTPLTPEATQCTEVIAGEGPLLQDGQLVLLGASLYDAGTGDELQSVGFDDDGPIPVVMGATVAGISKGLTCAREGSRVVVVIPPSDAVQDGADPSAGVPDTGLVAVLDVARAFPTHADGTPRLTRDGFPAVVLAPDGRPGITVPKSEPFDTTEIEVLKEGSGAAVEEGDQVVVQYTAVDWNEGSVIRSSWEDGKPTLVVASEDGVAQTLAGTADAIIGQAVGSQVGVVVPGDQGEATFYVIDILGVI
ncbi:FKBP-type peptidyl-prolyl cis-trans isomerase [Agromyces sp. MMS24-K17]|uniref:FKBP-type peptidyl-prolyl cis-trans isomerase n=1 Tax=Agromyces sp. MMS24-K17 TaxID=3372850 RepID=UPI003754B2C4